MYPREILRKLFHLSTCIFPFLLYSYGKEACFPYFLIFLVSFVLFDIGRQKSIFISSVYNYFFSILTRDYEQRKLTGASYVCFSVIVVTFFFDEKIAIASLLIMSIADPCASLFGQYFGQFKIHTKTLEGSIIFFIVSSAILISFSISYMEVIIVSLICTIAELFSEKIKIDDNFLIPVIGSMTLFSLQYI